jgi:integrase
LSAAIDNVAVFPVPAEVESADDQRKKDNDGLHKRRGIWHYKIREGGRWKEISTGTRSYQEAKKVRHRKLQEIAEGRKLPDIANMSLEKVSQQWLVGRAKLVSRNTYRIDRDRLKRLRERLGDKKLVNITVDDISAYQLARIDKVGPRTVNLEIKVLRQVLRTARLWARLSDEYKPLKERRRGPGRALSAEQEQRLFSTAQKSLYWSAAYYAAMVAANTTMRGCELKALRLRDVDLMNRTVTIPQSKTDSGCRVIPLNDAAVAALKQLFKRAALLGAKEPEHYLFPAFSHRHTQEPGITPKGAGYDPTKPMVSWRTAWRNLTAKAGLPGLRFHDMRHHAVTKLAENGVADQTLMAIAGHVSKEMLEHYSHIRMEAKRAAVESLTSCTPSAVVAAESDASSEAVN